MEDFLDILQQIVASKIFAAVITAVAGILIIKIILRVLKTAFSKMEPAMSKLLLRVAKPVLYALLALTVVASLGIDVTGIVALASVLTLAISLSLQSALTNIFGGFTLLNTKPFAEGDFVEIAGQSGTVQTIDITYTKLATADNKIVSIPNSSVVASQIINYSASGTRRVDIIVSASYGTPVEAVKQALVSAAAIPTVLDTPAPFAGVRNYGESAVEYVLQVWTSADDYWTTLFTVNERISAAFAEAGVEMTYPHLNVHVKS